MRVLVVEDVPPLAQAIAEGLRREAIAADVALDGGAALERLAVNDYDVVILDRTFPSSMATRSAGHWSAARPWCGSSC